MEFKESLDFVSLFSYTFIKGFLVFLETDSKFSYSKWKNEYIDNSKSHVMIVVKVSRKVKSSRELVAKLTAWKLKGDHDLQPESEEKPEVGNNWIISFSESSCSNNT